MIGVITDSTTFSANSYSTTFSVNISANTNVSANTNINIIITDSNKNTVCSVNTTDSCKIISVTGVYIKNGADTPSLKS